MLPLRLLPEADLEIFAAAEWYDSEKPGLGREFAAEVVRLLGIIQDSPRLWPSWPGTGKRLGIRRALMVRFPYAIAYVASGAEVLVLAVPHLSRAPIYWRDRLRP